MKGILAALVLVVLAIVLAVLLVPEAKEEEPVRPEAEPAPAVPRPPEEPPPPLANGAPETAPPTGEGESGFAVRGKVVDGLGAPIPDARVIPPAGVEGLTDEHGAFEVLVPGAGPVELQVRHLAWRDTSARFTAPCENQVIVLDRGLTVTGRVAFPDGRPVPGIGLHTADQGAATTTDQDGRYELAGLEPGTVEVRCRVARESRTVEAGAVGVDFVVKDHVVRLRFVDEAGDPVSEGTFKVEGELDGETVYTMVALLGTESTHQLNLIRTGTELDVSLSAEGFDPRETRVRIDGEPRLHDVEIVMTREGLKGDLELRVVNERGSPLSRAYLELSTEAGTSVNGFFDRELELDGDGRARLRVPAGSYDLLVTDAHIITGFFGYSLRSKRRIEVRPGETLSVEVSLRLGGRIRVTARDADGEVAPLRSVRLFDRNSNPVKGWFYRIIEGGWTSELDRPGPAVFDTPIPPGRYRLRLEREGKTVAEQDVDVDPGKTTEVEIRLPRR